MKHSKAVIGLGNMGSAIADALISKEHQVTVWNRSPEKASNLVESGATLADSPADALNSSDVVLVCVSNAAACEEIISAEGFAEKLQDKNAEYLSAVILHGKSGSAMPPWKALLSPEEARWIADRLLQGVLQ